MTAEPGDLPQRRRAVDPAHSVILEAPAGSGKTKLLVERYLNLLGRVEQPEEILAITFTTKAAREMRQRVIAALAEDAAIGDLDRRRGWNLDNRPDRLKIQTIDSFALGLARRLPIASGLIAERPEEDATALYEEAARRLLARMVETDAEGDKVADFVALLDNDAQRAKRFIAAALGKRDQWLEVVRNAADPTQAVLDSIAAAVERLRSAATAPLGKTLDAALRRRIEALGAVLAADRGRPWVGLDDPDGWQLIARSLLTQKGTPRKRFDRRQRFERLDPAEKREAREAAEALAAAGLVAQLASVSTLPDPDRNAGDEQILRTIATALVLAVADLYDTFDAHGVMDFTELTVAAKRALKSDDLPTELLLALDYRIRHVLVDEFQDTSLSQHEMLVALLEGWQPGDGNTFFAVGDPMQSIYRFRDANLRQFLETAQRSRFQHLPLQRLRLTSNFRSDAALVNWCNGAFRALFGEKTDPVHGTVAFTASIAERGQDGAAGNDAAQGVQTIICLGNVASGSPAEGIAVADRVDQIQHLDAGASIAILVRTRPVLEPILPALQQRGIPWHGTDLEQLGDEPVVRDLESLTVTLFDSGNRLAWLALLRSPLVGLDLVDLEQAAQTGRSLPDGLSASGRRRWTRLAAALNQDERSAPPRARVERIWLAFGGADAYREPSAIANAEHFFDLLDQRPAIARQPTVLRRELARLYAESAADDSGVAVMTIHKAKGLEFDHVIVPGLARTSARDPHPLLLWRREGEHLLIAASAQRGTGSLYDWLVAEERDQDDNERKRLFYVAATRAARSLTLIGTVEDSDRRPPKGSLLDLIWDSERPRMRFVGDSEAAGAAADETPPAPRVLTRLPEDYRFSPPVELPAVAPRTSHAIQHPATDIGSRREVALGEFMHRELKYLAERGTDAEYDATRRQPIWTRWSTAAGLSASDADWASKHLDRQIRGVLADERGRWILFQASDGLCEAPFVSAVDGTFTRIVVDRTFVRDDERWIVDYKTSILDGSDEEAVATLCRRHTPQLQRYAEAFAAIDPRPLRTALYLTSIPRFVAIDAQGHPKVGSER